MRFILHFVKTTPNVVVECLTLLFRIRRVSGSNPYPETSYPDWSFPWFSSVPPDKLYLKLSHDHFLPYIFKFMIYLWSFNSTLCILITEKASLNKLQVSNIVWTDKSWRCFGVLVFRASRNNRNETLYTVNNCLWNHHPWRLISFWLLNP
jgi:hypothetical protein